MLAAFSPDFPGVSVRWVPHLSQTELIKPRVTIYPSDVGIY